MTATTTTRPALRFRSADVTTGIVAYAVASRHDARRTNVVSLDTQTGNTFCTCKAAECLKGCWHEAAIQAAWAAELAALGVAWMSDAQLMRLGRKSRLCVDTYRIRTGRSRIEDRVALLAARAEWRRRTRRGLIERDALPVAA